jgi:hypothetical protein
VLKQPNRANFKEVSMILNYCLEGSMGWNQIELADNWQDVLTAKVGEMVAERKLADAEIEMARMQEELQNSLTAILPRM